MWVLGPHRGSPCATGPPAPALSRCPSSAWLPGAVELMKPGSYVTLRNAKVDMFRGSMRLAVNQVGAGGLRLLPLCVAGTAQMCWEEGGRGG